MADNCTFVCVYVCTDIPLSVGILDPRASPTQLNAVEFLWDPSKRASAFIQVRRREVAHRGEAGALGSTLQFLKPNPSLQGPTGLLFSVAEKETKGGGSVECCLIRAGWSQGWEKDWNVLESCVGFAYAYVSFYKTNISWHEQFEAKIFPLIVCY